MRTQASHTVLTGAVRPLSLFRPSPRVSSSPCKTINRSHAHRTYRLRKHPRHRQTSHSNTERERETAQRESTQPKSRVFPRCATKPHCSVVALRGEYAERRKKYDIIFRFSLKMEYPRAYKWNIIEYPRKYDIIFHLGLP